MSLSLIFVPLIIIMFAGFGFYLGYDVARYRATHGGLKGQHPDPTKLKWYRA